MPATEINLFIACNAGLEKNLSLPWESLSLLFL